MRWPWLLALAACTTSTPPDVVGPFAGAPHRFVVDRMTLPAYATIEQLGDDLDGSGQPEDQLGNVIGFLAGQHDASTHAQDMIASGVIGSVVEIQADDLANDAHVGVTYHGVDGDAATVMGGALVAGSLHSNRARTTHVPGAATVIVPVFADADPSTLDVQLMEIDLDADSAGGFDAIVRGGITLASADAAMIAGIRQMLAADPATHAGFAALLDANRDGTISDDEILHNPVVESLVAPDLVKANLLSIGIGVHLAPCPSGACAVSSSLDACHDRVLDEDETDVDCGGTHCMPCGPQLGCQVAADCQTAACDTGRCRAPSCSNSVQDGFELGVDCGGPCAFCTGAPCTADAQCKSGTCAVDRVCR